MNEDVKTMVERLGANLQNFHEEFAVFRTEIRGVVNGGPGKSDECNNHKNELKALNSRLSVIEKHLYVWIGGAFVVRGVIAALTNKILKVLGI